MNKSDVYSWRISPATKGALEVEARRAGTTVAALLDRITAEWIQSSRRNVADREQQERLHAGVRKTLGSIAGRNPSRSEQAKALVRQRLKR